MAKSGAAVTTRSTLLCDKPVAGQLVVNELRAIDLGVKAGATVDCITFNNWTPYPCVVKSGSIVLWTMENIVLTYFQSGAVTLIFNQIITDWYPDGPSGNHLHAVGETAEGGLVTTWDAGQVLAFPPPLNPVTLESTYDPGLYNNLVRAQLTIDPGPWI